MTRFGVAALDGKQDLLETNGLRAEFVADEDISIAGMDGQCAALVAWLG